MFWNIILTHLISGPNSPQRKLWSEYGASNKLGWFPGPNHQRPELCADSIADYRTSKQRVSFAVDGRVNQTFLGKQLPAKLATMKTEWFQSSLEEQETLNLFVSIIINIE